MIREFANYPCEGNSANLQKTADISRHSRERSQREASDCGLATGTLGIEGRGTAAALPFPEFRVVRKATSNTGIRPFYPGMFNYG